MRCCGQSRAIVAYSVRMARFHARRFRPNVQVRRVPLPAVADSRRGRQYRAKFTRLAAKPTHKHARVVDSMGRRSCRSVRVCPRSSGYLDYCPELDGNGLHSQCKAVRKDPLPVHRPLLSRDDRAGRRARFRPRIRRHLRLADIGRRNSARKQTPVVGDRACLGQILLRQNAQAPFVPRGLFVHWRLPAFRAQGQLRVEGGKTICRGRRSSTAVVDLPNRDA
jgi:hypothetical protein